MLTYGRLAKLALPVAVPGTLYLMSGTVFAASDTKESDPSLMVDELSLYTSPHSQVNYVEAEVGHVEQGVSVLRKSAEPYTKWCQEKTTYALDKTEEFYKTVEPGVDTSLRTIKDTYDFLNDPPPEFYPSVGVVGFSGILGLYLAKGKFVIFVFFLFDQWLLFSLLLRMTGAVFLHLFSGCRVKRLLFPGGLMTLSASLFYPQHAAYVVKAGKEQISSWGSQGRILFQGLWKGKSSAKEEK
uniref:MICOS complex subunit n=1 Tax=Pygocentrus nattereri TaxID=42514 RepID=A0A3B4E848_PYGNA